MTNSLARTNGGLSQGEGRTTPWTPYRDPSPYRGAYASIAHVRSSRLIVFAEEKYRPWRRPAAGSRSFARTDRSGRLARTGQPMWPWRALSTSRQSVCFKERRRYV